MMRIDEFSKPSDVNGTLSDQEKIRFLTFGFDTVYVELNFWKELISFNSLITLEKSFESLITKEKSIETEITKEVAFASPITEEQVFDSEITRIVDFQTLTGD